MEVVRGIGALAVLFGVSGLLTRLSGPIRFRASVNPAWMSSLWRWSGRVGVVLCVAGGLLLLISLL
jgi:hypothetical protein